MSKAHQSLAQHAALLVARAPRAAVAFARVVARSLPLTVACDDRRLWSDTTISGSGRVVVVIATALPDLGLTLTSSYLGAAHGPSAAMTLLEAPRRKTTLRSERLDNREHPITHARDRLLLHHAAVVLEVLQDELEGTVVVDVPPSSLDAARLAYPTN